MKAEIGQELPPLDLTITREGVVRYSGASTDFNPIHYSDFHAKALGMDGCIAHGMWTMGASLRIVTDWVKDPSLVKSYFVRFTNPVPVPDDDQGTKVEVRAKVTAVEDDLATIAIEAICVGNKVLGAAKAQVQLGEETDPKVGEQEASETVGVAEVVQTESLNLSDHTTFRVGGPAKDLVIAATEAELIETVKKCDQEGIPVMVLSGGSNMLVSDEGFAGTVVKVATKGIQAEVSDCSGAVVTVQAGENWDEFVQYAVSQGWIGIEALSGIPGLVGTAPVQNIGAYGAELAQTVTRVRTYDRETGHYATFPLSECYFGYRTSRFKQTRYQDSPTGRYVILDVGFQFLLGDQSAPIRYRELADRLGVDVGGRAPLAEVRKAVLEIRAAKGMVLNPADRDTWSAGSFFTNPIISSQQAASLPEDAPRFDQPDGTVKTSAAWLINHAGFDKGFGLEEGVTLSTKHVLALTNRGTGTAAQIARLAAKVKAGVAKKYGVELVPEPVLVGIEI